MTSIHFCGKAGITLQKGRAEDYSQLINVSSREQQPSGGVPTLLLNVKNSKENKL